MANFTPLARLWFRRAARLTDYAPGSLQAMQEAELRRLLLTASSTEQGRRYSYKSLMNASDIARQYTLEVPLIEYEDIRQEVMRMVHGSRDVLWPGICRSFAQSSGTSGGRSKYVPVTDESLRWNHYRGGSDVVANYLRLVPESRLFAGKAMILGGSFANTLEEKLPAGVRVGDVSASLISRMNPLAGAFRIPDIKTALMSDWTIKLPALVDAARCADVTNISGVPSWFLTVILKLLDEAGTDAIHDVWPNLEVFFHGGISFLPYRAQYEAICRKRPMRFQETYNASEGFFAVQNDFDDRSMLLLVNAGVFYEFIPFPGGGDPVPAWNVESGRTYEMVVSAANGLWRYRLGDTVRIAQADPLKITIAGRTKTFINAFGEELMEHNAENAMGEACCRHGAEVANYTAAPIYAESGRRGRHEWLIEWRKAPDDSTAFASDLDMLLRKENSDYDAKRTGNLFLDSLIVTDAPRGLFDRWLATTGARRLGGQRKVPRLSNDRRVIDALKELMEQVLAI